jgi:hypothetical protein
MSHTSTYAQRITSISLFIRKVKANGGEIITSTDKELISTQLFAETIKAEMVVRLPGWKYDIAMVNGELKYDHWGSAPGSMEVFHKIMQEYNTELISESLQYNMDIQFSSCEKNEREEMVFTLIY